MIPVAAYGFVVMGALILVAALFSIRRLMAQLPQGPVRGRWQAMQMLVAAFLVGYLGYAGVSWNHHAKLLDLIVPVVFLLGACFVWLAANLSLQTTMDVMRISVLEKEARIDPLTGVLNRRSLDRRLAEEIARSVRYGEPLSALLIDIDHFKHVNDRYGHQAGELVLATLAKVVAQELRETDFVARYGGEEFMIVMPHTLLSQVTQTAERVRGAVAAHDFGLPDKTGEGRRFEVTISIGAASLGQGIDNSEGLILAADKNLYQAKEQGRNRVVSGTAGAS